MSKPFPRGKKKKSVYQKKKYPTVQYYNNAYIFTSLYFYKNYKLNL